MTPADQCGHADDDGRCRCDCRLCYLMGHRGPITDPTHLNPATPPTIVTTPAKAPTLFDEEKV